MTPASAELTQAVGRDVHRMLGGKLDSLSRTIGDAPLGRDQASGVAAGLDRLRELITGGGSLKQIVQAGRSLRDTLGSLKPKADAPAGLDEWVKNATSELEKTLLLAGINDAIADALAGGTEGAAGPLGPGDLAPGGDGPDPPGPGGPGDLAPGGDGPGPVPDPPAGDEGGFDIDLDVHLWFGHGGSPIICYPHLPPGSCWSIGGTILVCGTGGLGEVTVMYGSPAYAGLPFPSEEPIGDAPAEADYVGKILLLNPAANVEPVQYTVGETPLVMDAGMMHGIRLQSTVIRFGRGPGLGEARYSLRPGTYKFVVTPHGWDLVRTSFQATLDNTANAEEFHLLLDGDLVTVSGRSLKQVKSDYPLLVEFDDGDGNEPARKQLADGETYTIGVDRETGLWDLFAGDATESGAGQADDVWVVASAGLLLAPESIAVPAN